MSKLTHEQVQNTEQNEDTRFSRGDRLAAGALLAFTVGTMFVARSCNAPEDPGYPTGETTVTQLYNVNEFDILGNGADSRDN
jgi:hypothetical protein